MPDVLDAQALEWAERYLVDVPALTLQNPWPRAITHLGKDIENRSWVAPQSLDRFMLHAGKAWDCAGMGMLRDLGWQAESYEGAQSAIVAVVDLAHVCTVSLRSDTLRCHCGAWAFPGQCHWRLTDVVPLPEPVPCRGAQKLWRPPADVVKAVAAQLAQIKIATKEGVRG